MSSSDLAFVERVQDGDAEAFDYLVIRHRHELLELITRYVRDPVQAEDIVQETFRKAQRALASFPRNGAFLVWLSRLAIDGAKRALTAPREHPVDDELPMPECLVLTDEMRDCVRSTIERLPRELRMALVLRETEGKTYAQIAAAMNCPERTVRSLIFLAREVINGQLRKLEPSS